MAAKIAAPVTDYAVFCRSHVHRGLDEALATFHASALLELGMDSADGTGAALAWPMIRSAAALLTDLHDLAEPRGPNTGSGVDSLSGGYRDSGSEPRLSA